MGDEIFSVYLTPADYSKLAYAKLDLPASPWKLLDAMDKVRLPEGDSLYLEITDYRKLEDFAFGPSDEKHQPDASPPIDCSAPYRMIPPKRSRVQ